MRRVDSSVARRRWVDVRTYRDSIFAIHDVSRPPPVHRRWQDTCRSPRAGRMTARMSCFDHLTSTGDDLECCTHFVHGYDFARTVLFHFFCLLPRGLALGVDHQWPAIQPVARCASTDHTAADYRGRRFQPVDQPFFTRCPVMAVFHARQWHWPRPASGSWARLRGFSPRPSSQYQSHHHRPVAPSQHTGARGRARGRNDAQATEWVC
jgi:hypothetical protein